MQKTIFIVIALFVFNVFLPSNVKAQETSGGFAEGSILIGPDNRACSGALAGSIRYNSSTTCTEYCDGTDWVCPGGGPGCTGPSGCTTPGDVCADGTIFIGWSMIDNSPLYTTRCDAGRTYSGSCTGTRVTKAWNNANITGYKLTNSVSIKDGEANTSALQSGGAQQDSDTVTGGVQPHQAAQYCADLDIHGYQDWYLPATSELYLMRIYHSGWDFDTTSNTTYWTSTERGGNADSAFYVDFDPDKPEANDDIKNISNNIRCVRR